MLEFIIYVGILGFVLTAATLFSIDFLTAKAKASAVSDVANAAGFAVERISYETRASSGIDFDDSVFAVNPGRLTLFTSDAGTDPTVFSVTDGTLYVQWGADAPVALTPADITVDEFVIEDISVRPRFRTVRVRLSASLTDAEAGDAYSSQVTLETTLRSWLNDGFSIP